ncbi:MAG: cytochrome c [Chlorobi bacterium]|nr:cytochrome c [Chlorobiota bacterium]
MKKLTFSALAVLFVFSLSTLFVSCGEETAKEDAKDTKEEVKEEVKVETEAKEETAVADYSKGKEIYASKCQACHQENGEGVGETFPGLKGKACDINIVANGVEGTAMVAFKGQLSNEELVDVVNYVNHAWDNNFDDVTTADIKE